jgi:DNA modification methylase
MTLDSIKQSIKQEPYFECEDGLLYCADCMDILPQLPEGCVDLVCSDAPFNAGKEFANDDLSPYEWRQFCLFIAKHCSRLTTNAVIEVSKKDLEMTKAFDSFMDFRWTICLNYTNSMRQGGVGYSNFGLALWFTNGGKCYHPYKDRIDSVLYDTKDEFQHPSPKEITHYSRLIEMFSEETDLVLDPFLGSGTTAVAAKRLGRKFIGIEISPDYCSIAKSRIQAEQKGITVAELKRGQKVLF